jgi:2-hydroxychromene-2-carboxylate isomerase
MPAAPIRFYLDRLSSNAYLAWDQPPALAAPYGRTIEGAPVLFSALLGIPLHRPAFHPFNPLLALHVSSLPMDEAAQARLVGGLLRAVWAESRHVSEPDVVAKIASEAGLDGPALVVAAQEPEAKARLERPTDAAIAAGVFGVPTMIVDGELFGGYDDFPFLERFLASDDPLDSKALEEWAGPPRRSAMRKQHRERL